MAEHYGTVIIPARPKKPSRQSQGRGGRADRRTADFGGVARSALSSVWPSSMRRSARSWPSSTSSPFRSWRARATVGLRPRKSQAAAAARRRPFELATWSKAKVNIDYHVAVDKHFYSVPYQLIHQPLDVRLTETTVELFQHGKRVAAHARSFRAGPVHDPGGTPAQVPSEVPGMDARPHPGVGQKIGPACAQLVEQIMEEPASSRTRLSLLPGHHSPGQSRSARSAWKPPAGAPCTLAPVPIAASNPFSSTAWTSNPWNRNCPCTARTTKICAVVLITTNPLPLTSMLYQSNPGKTPGLAPGGHGPGPRRTTPAKRHRRAGL